MTWEADRRQREEGRALAGPILEAQGFRANGNGWRGQLAGFVCDIELPKSFPFALPRIRLDRTRHDDLIAHVDAKGTICFADTTNILLDAGNPEGLLLQAIERATKILEAGAASGVSVVHEFAAYWEADKNITSLCTLDDTAREIAVTKRLAARPWYLAADDKEQLDTWLANSRRPVATGLLAGCIVPLVEPPVSFLRAKTLRVRDLCRAIREQTSPATRDVLNPLLARARLPCIVIMTFPATAGSRGAVGFVLQRPARTPGFRPGKMRASHVLRYALAESIEKLAVQRADSSYLLPRAGGTDDLKGAAVVVVGAGAVGGWVARLLASSGVGRLGIIDPDIFSRDNVHRHVLGMSAVGSNKAEALATHLAELFPHQQFWFRTDDCIAVLSDENFVFKDATLVILATGNETLELRVSGAFRKRAQLVHVWLDPFDLGFHILVDGKNERGCFRCLFDRNEDVGLHNRASFLEKGQEVTRTLAGCSGNFAPYTMKHALAAASALVELVATGQAAKGSFLDSRFCSDEAVLANGFTASPRRLMFNPNETRRVNDFRSGACEVCGA